MRIFVTTILVFVCISYLVSLTSGVKRKCQINRRTGQVERVIGGDFIVDSKAVSFDCPGNENPVYEPSFQAKPKPVPLSERELREKKYCSQLTRFRFENFNTVDDWVTDLYDDEYQRYLSSLPPICLRYLRTPGNEPDVVIKPDLSLFDPVTRTWKDPGASRAIFWGNEG